jgi:hypothetical protein
VAAVQQQQAGVLVQGFFAPAAQQQHQHQQQEVQEVQVAVQLALWAAQGQPTS